MLLHLKLANCAAMVRVVISVFFINLMMHGIPFALLHALDFLRTILMKIQLFLLLTISKRVDSLLLSDYFDLVDFFLKILNRSLQFEVN